MSRHVRSERAQSVKHEKQSKGGKKKRVRKIQEWNRWSVTRTYSLNDKALQDAGLSPPPTKTRTAGTYFQLDKKKGDGVVGETGASDGDAAGRERDTKAPAREIALFRVPGASE
jgi:hypothetical protein